MTLPVWSSNLEDLVLRQNMKVKAQGGHQGLNQLKFGKTNIHNTKNIVEIPAGEGKLHNLVTAHYQSKFDFTNGKTVREWLSTQDFDFQYSYGIETLRKFGWKGTIE